MAGDLIVIKAFALARLPRWWAHSFLFLVFAYSPHPSIIHTSITLCICICSVLLTVRYWGFTCTGDAALQPPASNTLVRHSGGATLSVWEQRGRMLSEHKICTNQWRGLFFCLCVCVCLCVFVCVRVWSKWSERKSIADASVTLLNH